MRSFHWSLLALAVMLLAGGPARASSPADDDPGMGDYWRRVQAETEMYQFELEARQRERQAAIERLAAARAALLRASGPPPASPADDDPGMGDGFSRMQADIERQKFDEAALERVKQEITPQEKHGSVLQGASNTLADGATDALQDAAGPAARSVLGKAAGKALSNTPVPDIATALGHASEGDVEGTARTVTSWAAGFFTTAAVTKALTAGGATGGPAGVAAVGVAILVGLGAKKVTEAVWDYVATPSAPQPRRLAKPPVVTPTVSSQPLLFPPGMRLTDEQIKTLSSILPPTPGPATATAPVPPRVVTDTKPPAVDPRLSPPVKQPTTTPAARPYVIYCQCCKNELALPAGQKAPPACPSCGRAKARIYETNDQGQKVLVGTGDWYWPKGARTGLRPGQWCE